jgi:hypothetical protein
MSLGIDIHIDNQVTDYTAKLWVGKVNQFYGRVFRNENEEGKIIPEWWISGNEYKEVLTDDTKDAQCFFDVLPASEVMGNDLKSEIQIYFMVNLYSLYPTYTRTEASEQVIRDVLNYTKGTVLRVTRGFESFKTWDYPQSSWRGDMSPYFLFRVDFTLIYNNC